MVLGPKDLINFSFKMKVFCTHGSYTVFGDGEEGCCVLDITDFKAVVSMLTMYWNHFSA